MAKICEICGKGPVAGSRIIRKGLAKKKGGIGLHTTAVTRRRFLPNLQKVRVRVGTSVCSKIVCSSCLKADKVIKA